MIKAKRPRVYKHLKLKTVGLDKMIIGTLVYSTTAIAEKKSRTFNISSSDDVVKGSYVSRIASLPMPCKSLREAKLRRYFNV